MSKLTIYNARFEITAAPTHIPPSTEEVRELYHETLTEMQRTIRRV